MITIRQDNNEEKKNYVHTHLRENNRNKCKWLFDNVSPDVTEPDTIEINFLAFDNEKVIGGACGYIEYNWYYLDLLWVDEKYRNQDVATNMLKQIEEYSRSNKLSGMWVETWNFQARGFYEKMGFSVFGEMKDCPPETVCYFLSKYLHFDNSTKPNEELLETLKEADDIMNEKIPSKSYHNVREMFADLDKEIDNN